MGEFPAGLKILIVDDDRTCLLVLETMLRKLLYEVTKCELARDALALLREDKNRFDIVICDLHMPDMDGFKLLEIIGLEMDLPVVMMSSDDGKGVVMKGIIHGACDYLVKPIRMEAIRLIWQHVVRKKKRILEEFQQPKNINVIDRSLLLQPAKDAVAEQMPGRDKGSFQNLKRVREDEKEDNDGESSDEVTTAKKPRVIWTQELHEMFVAAVNQLGRDKAVPKKILECMQAMNVTGLTRANIASHLQKYRMHLQKEGQVQPSTDNRDVNAFSEQASSIRLRNLQFQPTGSSCQLPLQHLITPQSWRSERANESLGAGPSHDQESNIYDPVVAESGHCDLPTDYFASHDLPRANLLYQNDCRLASGVAISNEEYLHRNVGNNLTELSKPSSAVDELIYEPLFLIGQYDQDDLFRGPFA